MNSDESTDMMLNHPDIERIEQKRKALAEQYDTISIHSSNPSDDDILSIHSLKDADETVSVHSDEIVMVQSDEDIMAQSEDIISIDSDEEIVAKKPEKRYLKLQQLEERRLRRLEKLELKRIAEETTMKKRKEKALKGMKYLLTLSEKFSSFFSEKLYGESPTKKLKKQPIQEKNSLQPTVEDMEEIANSRKHMPVRKERIDVTKHLKYFEGGKLHPYQIEGVTWLTVLQENGINGILADEMGLGKTIQVIALFCYLIEKSTPGPFLIVVPLSTLSNWKSEFERFAPKLPVILFHGDKFTRPSIQHKINKKYEVDNFKTYPIIITSYEYPYREKNFFKRFEYQYIVVDEGHRIKNHESQLALSLRSLSSSNRLLLTGTPLQNNIQELWSLLNFIMPQIFTNMDTFASLIMLEDMEDENKLLEQEERTNIIGTLHKVLAPFMLRRLKKDVLIDMVPKKEVFVDCPLSKIQKKLYAYVIDQNIQALYRNESSNVVNLDEPPAKRKCAEKRKQISYYKYLESDDEMISDDELLNDYYKDQKVDQELMKANNIKGTEVEFVVRLTMMNRMVMYKKIVNHPYLVHFPLNPTSKKKELLINEDLVNHSGKMKVLDAMLAKLRSRGHKVLIFSTLVMTLDLIEEMFIMRDYTYRRLDGSCRLDQRTDSIFEFNNDPNILAFLISTRAGGLGLNLTGADTVIFFDRDWNPQCDIQAQDRCHRIGQTKPVMVYTFVSKNTIDEAIIKRGRQKRLLEKLVIKDGKFKNLGQNERVILASELQELRELLNKEQETFEEAFNNRELNRLLDRSELYKIMKESKSKSL